MQRYPKLASCENVLSTAMKCHRSMIAHQPFSLVRALLARFEIGFSTSPNLVVLQDRKDVLYYAHTKQVTQKYDCSHDLDVLRRSFLLSCSRDLGLFHFVYAQQKSSMFLLFQDTQTSFREEQNTTGKVGQLMLRASLPW